MNVSDRSLWPRLTWPLAPFTALVVVCGLCVAPGTASAGGDVDCFDFSSQAAAQSFFISAGGPSSDPHNLDGDGDGVACESNPCPCSSGGGAPPPPPPPTPPAPPPPVDPKAEHGNVIRVVDGDTLEVKVGAAVETVRLIGIDTPESVQPGVPVECGAVKATRSLSAVARSGDRVRLVSDPSQDDRDSFGRLLRYVEEAGLDYGHRQIKRGWAKPYVFETPFKRLATYKAAKRKAKRAHRGVWKRCAGDFHSAS